MPTRQEWMLRFIAGPPGYKYAVDRIRLMKGMFLFQKEGGAPPDVDYKFTPYDYGPFTPEVYRDAEALAAEGLVLEARDGQSYRITEAGRLALAKYNFPEALTETLDQFRIEVTEATFKELLRRVYTAYPESASRSVAKDVLR